MLREMWQEVLAARSSSDRQLRYSGKSSNHGRIKNSLVSAMRSALHSSTTIKVGCAAAVAWKEVSRGVTTVKIYLGDLEFAHRASGGLSGKRRATFMYVQEGNCSNTTCWFRWYGVKGSIVSAAGENEAIDPTDISERYVMASCTDYTATKPVSIQGNDLRPIIRGVTMIPCSEETCCGHCYLLDPDDRKAICEFMDSHG